MSSMAATSSLLIQNPTIFSRHRRPLLPLPTSPTTLSFLSKSSSTQPQALQIKSTNNCTTHTLNCLGKDSSSNIFGGDEFWAKTVNVVDSLLKNITEEPKETKPSSFDVDDIVKTISEVLKYNKELNSTIDTVVKLLSKLRTLEEVTSEILELLPKWDVFPDCNEENCAVSWLILASYLLLQDLNKSSDDSQEVKEYVKSSILKLQIGLSGMGIRSLQDDLNRIAENADTSNASGWKYILTETSVTLLQHLDYCNSSYSSVDLKQNIEEGEECFKKYSKEEIDKYDELTLVNLNNVKRRISSNQYKNQHPTQHFVITILVAGQGEIKLPTIRNRRDLKEALLKLGSIPESKLQAVEVLWTPQHENDSLTKQELEDKYSNLRNLTA